MTGRRKTERYQNIEVEYFDISFKKQKQKFSGFDAFFSLYYIDNPDNKFEYNQSLAIQIRFESKEKVVTERELTWRRKGSALFFSVNFSHETKILEQPNYIKSTEQKFDLVCTFFDIYVIMKNQMTE